MSTKLSHDYCNAWKLYLAGKDDNLLDDPGSLVLQELLDDVFTDGTSPNDSKVCVS